MHRTANHVNSITKIGTAIESEGTEPRVALDAMQETLNTRLDELKTTLDTNQSTTDTISELHTSIAVKNEKIAGMERDVEERHTIIDQLRTSERTLRDAISELQAKVVLLEEVKVQSTITSLQLQDATKHVDSLTTEVRDLRMSKQELDKQLQESQISLANCKKEAEGLQVRKARPHSMQTAYSTQWELLTRNDLMVTTHDSTQDLETMVSIDVIIRGAELISSS